MSRMFLNQVSSRELFTVGREKKNSQVNDSNSQNMYFNSQKDFSENSQDFCSQPLSGETVACEPQGRRVFDRFMTKRTNSDTFRSSTPLKPTFMQNGSCNTDIPRAGKPSMKPNFQQQVLMNKSKAKERDDREMFETIVNAVKEYSDEVKGTIKIVQDNIEQVADNSNEKFSLMANSIFDGLNENFDRIVQAVKDREEKKRKIHDLEKEISMRDAKIDELRNEVEGKQADRDQHLLESVNKVLQLHHTETIKKLKEMKDCMTKNSEYQEMLVEGQKQHQDVMGQHHEELQSNQRKRHEEIKNGIISELQQLRQDLETHRNQLEDIYSTQLSTTHYKSMKEMQYHISTGLEKHAQENRDFSKEICNFQLGHLNDIYEKQENSHQKLVDSILKEQGQMRSMENERFIKQIEQITFKKINDYIGNQNARSTRPENETGTKNVQKQLDEMFNRYNQELSKMKHQMEMTTKEKESYHYKQDQVESRKKDFFTNRYENENLKSNNFQIDKEHSLKSKDNDIHRSQSVTGKNKEPSNVNGKSFAFVSPGCRPNVWSMKSVFSKPNPSPVAAVLPQPHNAENIENNRQPIKRGKRGKRKRKSYNQPSRRSSRLNGRNSDADIETSDASQCLNTSQEKCFTSSQHQKEAYHDLFTKNTLYVNKSQQDSFSVNSSQNKAVPVFKKPQNITSSLSQNRYSSQKSFNGLQNASASTESSNKEKKPIQANVFPVRPNTYSNAGNVQNLRKCPSVVSAFEPVRRYKDNSNISSFLTDSQNSTNKQKSQSVYDFSESPDRESQNKHRIIRKESGNVSNSQNVASESSRESSPSLSITKIMIQRKVRNNKRPFSMTPLRKQEVLKPNESSDFFTTPIVEDKENLSNKWESQSVMSNYRRSGEKRKLFNFDLDKELLTIKKAFKL